MRLTNARTLLATAALAAGAHGQSAPAHLTLFTSYGSDITAPVVQRFESVTGARVTVVQLDSQVVLARLRGEQRASAASGIRRSEPSVWWGADDVTLYEAATEGLLAPTSPAWSKSIPADRRDPSGLWAGQFEVPFAVVFRPGAVELPVRFEDLASPVYRGRLLLRLPTDSQPMKLWLCAAIELRMREASGSEESAFDWIAMVDSNRADDYLTRSEELLDRISTSRYAAGPGDLTVWPASDAARLRDREGFAVDFLVPAGSPEIVEGAAMLAGAFDTKICEQFLDFIGRDEWLSRYVQHGRIPMPLSRVDEKALPAWMPVAVANARPMRRGLIAEKMPYWTQRFEQRVSSGVVPGQAAAESTSGWMAFFDILGTLLIGVALLLILRRGRWKENAA